MKGVVILGMHLSGLFCFVAYPFGCLFTGRYVTSQLAYFVSVKIFLHLML